AISVLTALIVGSILFFLGVPLALAFAFLVFVLNFVPNVGSMIATVLPIPILLGSDQISGATTALAIALPAAVQMLIGQLLEPKLMGRSLDLHPVAVLLGLVFWGMLWGLVGVLLAVPMTSAIKIVLVEMGYTQPIADLLAERRATPRRRHED
ncbi:MAG: AI-2E family transporter, partial [Planctomycetota bacterium]